MPYQSTPQSIPTIRAVRQFKARIEPSDASDVHAIEVWFMAPDIISAGQFLVTYFGALAVSAGDVVRLIEQE